MTSPIVFSGLSSRGLVRARNEDNWLADPERGLFVVADGMGSRNGGAVASELVVEQLPALLPMQALDSCELCEIGAAEALRAALFALNRRICECAREHPELTGMGAALVMVFIRRARALVAHLGDSRAYRLRDGHLTALTRDHSIVRYLVDAGEISEEQARRHPARSQISRYAGMKGEVLADVCCKELRDGDRLLLCTDGLTRMLPEPEIGALLTDSPDPPAACRALVEAAKAAGSEDDITALVIGWQDP